MNTLLLRDSDLSQRPGGPALARVAGDRARHLIGELDVSPGDRVRVGVIAGKLGWGEVESIGDEELELAVEIAEDPPAKLPLTLIVGLARPKALRRILVDATAAGVERIVVVGSWRAPKSYWQSPLLEPGAVESHLIAGLAQAGDSRLPAYESYGRFRPFAEDVLPGLARDARCLLADPDADQACERASGERIVLVVGPDRGFTDFERDLVAAAGAERVTLGPRTQRVHAAVMMAIGRLF